MNLFKFRFTLPSDMTVDLNQFGTIYACIAQTINPATDPRVTYFTAGYEEQDKCGEPTNPHIHLHFESVKQIGTLRKSFQRLFGKELKEFTVGRKGNNLYSLTLEDDVKDRDRFFRYPLKQNSKHKFHAYLQKQTLPFAPPDFDRELQQIVANDEWNRDIDFNLEKRRKLENTTKRKDELFDYLELRFENSHSPSRRELLLAIIEYYAQEKLSANRATIMGYFQTALWHFQIEQLSETADRWLESHL